MSVHANVKFGYGLARGREWASDLAPAKYIMLNA
jgi:hypothetical protein